VLVSLHGWADCGDVFAPLFTALNRHWTVVAPDAPAHGGSSWRRTWRYRIDDVTSVVLAVLDELPQVVGPSNGVVLHGHSLGALPAAHLAAARPQFVRHLVVEEPINAVRHADLAARARHVAQDALIPIWVTRLRRFSAAELTAEFRSDMPGAPLDEFPGWAAGKKQVSLTSLIVPVAWGAPLVEILPRVQCPVTIIRGAPERHGMVTDEAARRCAAVCAAGAEVHALDAGHDPRRQCREEFAGVMSDVLGRYEGVPSDGVMHG
jgi:pimeloyl-ACP methyl ester carboxylesterase